MQNVLRVRWRVTPLETPRVWLHCGHCGAKRPFISSGKFRSNAQKKRLDVWLIYRCADCSQTWNYPILERRAVGEIAPPLFQAIAGNCAETARRYACDVSRLRSYVDRIEVCQNIRVEKSILGARDAAPSEIVIALTLPEPCDLRLERLLAQELSLSRNAVRGLTEHRALAVEPAGRTVLRQAVRDGQRVVIDLRAVKNSDLTAAIVAGAA